MKFAYADPPYLGCCKLYGHHHPAGDRPFDGRCWDDVETHRALFGWLLAFDGYAVSASTPSLGRLLPLAPDARIAAWVKTFCANNSAAAMEAVLRFVRSWPAPATPSGDPTPAAVRASWVYVDSKPPASEETSRCGGCGEPSAPWEGWQRPDPGCWWTWDCEEQMWLFLCKDDRATAGTAGAK